MINAQVKVAIVRSNYYPDLTRSLQKACKEFLNNAGVKTIETFIVPGSWEIPLMVKKIASAGKFDGIIALGVIIKGKTYHFELIANECARSLMNISLEYSIPVAFEILAVFSLEQAKTRSIGRYNKGIEAAETLLRTIKQLHQV